jgi:putative ABC transport system substrate-binding protein
VTGDVRGYGHRPVKSRGHVVLSVVLAAIIATPGLPVAQLAGKMPKIGVLLPQSASLSAANITALREGLRHLGYVEGETIVVEYRFADGKLERLPALAAELIRAEVQMLVVGGTTPARVAKEATSTLPILFAGVSDPVEAGLAASFARPGGNATGFSTAHEDGFAGKWIELLREVVPTVARVGVLHNPSNPSNVKYWREIQTAAPRLKVALHSLEATTVEGLDRALTAARREHHDGLIVVTDPFLFAHRRRIVSAANQQKLPAVFGFKEFVRDGGLVSYGASLPDMYRRAATYVDRLLKGAKPGELPIEQPRKFELAVNLRTAKALGVVIPQSVLVRVDEVIQ